MAAARTNNSALALSPAGSHAIDDLVDAAEVAAVVEAQAAGRRPSFVGLEDAQAAQAAAAAAALEEERPGSHAPTNSVEEGSTFFMIGRVRNLMNQKYLAEHGSLSIKFDVNGKTKFTTQTFKGQGEPVWNEICHCKLEPWDCVTFSLVDSDWGLSDVLGSATMTLQSPLGSDRLWIPLLNPETPKVFAELLIVMDAGEMPPPSVRSDDNIGPSRPTSLGADLEVGVVLAKNFPSCNPCVALTLGTTTHQTKAGAKKAVTAAEFTETFRFPRRTGTIQTTLLDRDSIGANALIGTGSVPAEGLRRQGTWVPLEDGKGRPAGVVLLQAGGVNPRFLVDPETGKPLLLMAAAATTGAATAVPAFNKSWSQESLLPEKADSVDSGDHAVSYGSSDESLSGERQLMSLKVISATEETRGRGMRFVQINLNGTTPPLRTRGTSIRPLRWNEDLLFEASDQDVVNFELASELHGELEEVLGAGKIRMNKLRGSKEVSIPLTHHGKPFGTIIVGCDAVSDPDPFPYPTPRPEHDVGQPQSTQSQAGPGTVGANAATTAGPTPGANSQRADTERPTDDITSEQDSIPIPVVQDVRVLSTEPLKKKCRPYVILEGTGPEGATSRFTQTLKRTRTPEWNETILLKLDEHSTLKFTMIAKHRFWKDKELGMAQVPGSVLVTKDDHSIPLQSEGKIVTTLKIKVRRE